MKKLAISLIAAASLIAHADTLRIGVEGAYPPFSFKTEQGELTGFDIDFARALCTEIKAECELVEIAWDGLIPSLNSQKIDAIIASMAATDERRQNVDFSNKYYNRSGGKFVMESDAAAQLNEDNYKTVLKGKIVGVQRSTIHERFLEGELKDTLDRIQSYNTQEEALLDLQAGRLDAVYADATQLTSGFLASSDSAGFAAAAPKFRVQKYYGDGSSIAIRKGEDALRERFNAGILALRDNGKYKEINDKYFEEDIYGDE
ncbi:MAG: transporter substrate-binding domain-containing protein [Cardiobacteriaceae bacterium]|nr:transporter substrate-binding domain-containing protein [Cardiobacteriaceae bacterium]